MGGLIGVRTAYLSLVLRHVGGLLFFQMFDERERFGGGRKLVMMLWCR